MDKAVLTWPALVRHLHVLAHARTGVSAEGLGRCLELALPLLLASLHDRLQQRVLSTVTQIGCCTIWRAATQSHRHSCKDMIR